MANSYINNKISPALDMAIIVFNIFLHAQALSQGLLVLPLSSPQKQGSMHLNSLDSGYQPNLRFTFGSPRFVRFRNDKKGTELKDPGPKLLYHDFLDLGPIFRHNPLKDVKKIVFQ